MGFMVLLRLTQILIKPQLLSLKRSSIKRKKIPTKITERCLNFSIAISPLLHHVIMDLATEEGSSAAIW
jgi:hypothetical protein